MAKYRKKPVVIEAVQWHGKEDTNRIINWLAQQKANLEGWLFHDTDIMIPTLEGDHRAMPNDWIISGVKGEFYPCKPDIFAASKANSIRVNLTSSPRLMRLPSDG